MLTAIRQTVQVNAEGVIEIRVPQLQPGQQAEVIVLVETSEAAAKRAERVAQLAAFFRELQASPQAQTLTEDDIAAEIAAYRASR
ncbi:MAG: hypothetical protein NZM11_01640 [Anaerolineales bacterium]|nr:hypothetical protein [Anaerolineales bacterium]